MKSSCHIRIIGPFFFRSLGYAKSLLESNWAALSRDLEKTSAEGEKADSADIQFNLTRPVPKCQDEHTPLDLRAPVLGSGTETSDLSHFKCLHSS